MLLGNYSDDVTALGTLGQIALGLTGLDTAADLRDLTYDLTHWDGTLAHAGQTLLDVVGLIPGIGALKNADEVAYLIKSALQSLFKSSDELTAAGKAAGKAGAETSEEIARAYAKTAEALGLGTAETGGAAQKYIDKAINAQNKYADRGVAAMKGNAGEAAGAAADDEFETLSKQFLDAWDESEEAIEGAGKTFTQGSKISAGVLETKPKYSPIPDKWLDNGGQITVSNGAWKYTNAQGDSVIYKNGYPDFKGSGHVKQEADIGGFTNRTTDFKKADQIAPNGPKSPDSTWHHNEDGKTLQEVNKKIHEQFRHEGGIAGMKKNK